VDTPEPLFSEMTLCVWAGTPWDLFPAQRLFRQAGIASVVSCPSCPDGHSEEVVLLEGPDGASRYVIPCPESLYVEIPPEQLRQWTIDFDSLANLAATALSLGGRCTVLVPGRLWRLGRTKWADGSRDVLFARGLAWADAKTVVNRATHATRPIVFVADRTPPPQIWPGRVPPLIALSQVATLCDGRLELDLDAVFAAIREADTAAASQTSTFTVDQLRDVVRQQLKAEEWTHLPDDAFAEAYRREGSYRKAAAFLSQATGREITKEKVANAVQRLGGAAAVLRSDDSDSIVRTVVSQRRDRSGKTLTSSKPQEVK
jgi:hypothetical protein